MVSTGARTAPVPLLGFTTVSFVCFVRLHRSLYDLRTAFFADTIVLAWRKVFLNSDKSSCVACFRNRAPRRCFWRLEAPRSLQRRGAYTASR